MNRVGDGDRNPGFGRVVGGIDDDIGVGDPDFETAARAADGEAGVAVSELVDLVRGIPIRLPEGIGRQTRARGSATELQETAVQADLVSHKAGWRFAQSPLDANHEGAIGDGGAAGVAVVVVFQAQRAGTALDQADALMAAKGDGGVGTHLSRDRLAEGDHIAADGGDRGTGLNGRPADLHANGNVLVGEARGKGQRAHASVRSADVAGDDKIPDRGGDGQDVEGGAVGRVADDGEQFAVAGSGGTGGEEAGAGTDRVVAVAGEQATAEDVQRAGAEVEGSSGRSNAGAGLNIERVDRALTGRGEGLGHRHLGVDGTGPLGVMVGALVRVVTGQWRDPVGTVGDPFVVGIGPAAKDAVGERRRAGEEDAVAGVDPEVGGVEHGRAAGKVATAEFKDATRIALETGKGEGGSPAAGGAVADDLEGAVLEHEVANGFGEVGGAGVVDELHDPAMADDGGVVGDAVGVVGELGVGEDQAGAAVRRVAHDVHAAAEGDVADVAREAAVRVGRVAERELRGRRDRGVVAEGDDAADRVNLGDRRVGRHPAAADAHADHQIGTVGDGDVSGVAGTTRRGLGDLKIALEDEGAVMQLDGAVDIDDGIRPGRRLLVTVAECGTANGEETADVVEATAELDAFADVDDAAQVDVAVQAHVPHADEGTADADASGTGIEVEGAVVHREITADGLRAEDAQHAGAGLVDRAAAADRKKLVGVGLRGVRPRNGREDLAHVHGARRDIEVELRVVDDVAAEVGGVLQGQATVFNPGFAGIDDVGADHAQVAGALLGDAQPAGHAGAELGVGVALLDVGAGTVADVAVDAGIQIAGGRVAANGENRGGVDGLRFPVFDDGAVAEVENPADGLIATHELEVSIAADTVHRVEHQGGAVVDLIEIAAALEQLQHGVTGGAAQGVADGDVATDRIADGGAKLDLGAGAGAAAVPEYQINASPGVVTRDGEHAGTGREDGARSRDGATDGDAAGLNTGNPVAVEGHRHLDQVGPALELVEEGMATGIAAVVNGEATASAHFKAVHLAAAQVTEDHPPIDVIAVNGQLTVGTDVGVEDGRRSRPTQQRSAQGHRWRRGIAGTAIDDMDGNNPTRGTQHRDRAGPGTAATREGDLRRSAVTGPRTADGEAGDLTIIDNRSSRGGGETARAVIAAGRAQGVVGILQPGSDQAGETQLLGVDITRGQSDQQAPS